MDLRQASDQIQKTTSRNSVVGGGCLIQTKGFILFVIVKGFKEHVVIG